MNVIKELLEEFYGRYEPLGVAFIEDRSVLFGAGRPCEFMVDRLPRSEGLCEIDYPNLGALVFAYSYRWERHLVVQYPSSSELSTGPPNSFVRLSAAVLNALENPGATPPASPPAEESLVPRTPPKPALGPAAAEADIEREEGE